jgi:hypothetical protein
VDDVLLAPDHGTDEPAAGVLDDEVLLRLDLRGRLLLRARVDQVVVLRTGRHASMLIATGPRIWTTRPDGVLLAVSTARPDRTATGESTVRRRADQH